MFNDKRIFKFLANVPAAIELLDNGESQDGTYGEQWRYKIRSDGREGYWYATMFVHRFIEGLGVGHGDVCELMLEEIPGKKSKRWQCVFDEKKYYSDTDNRDAHKVSSITGSLRAGEPVETAGGITPGPATGMSVPPTGSPSSYVAIAASYHTAIMLSCAIWRDVWTMDYTSEDVRATAASLFIEGCKKNIQPSAGQVEKIIKLAKEMEDSGG